MAIHMFYIGKWQTHIYLIAGPSEMINITVFDLISGLSAYVILGPKNRPN